MRGTDESFADHREQHHCADLRRDQAGVLEKNNRRIHFDFLFFAINRSISASSSWLTSRVVRRWFTASNRLPSNSRSTRWFAMRWDTSPALTLGRYAKE